MFCSILKNSENLYESKKCIQTLAKYQPSPSYISNIILASQLLVLDTY